MEPNEHVVQHDIESPNQPVVPDGQILVFCHHQHVVTGADASVCQLYDDEQREDGFASSKSGPNSESTSVL